MLDKILAGLFMLLLIAFMGIVLLYINEVALWVIVGTVLLMGIYDFYVEVRGGG